MYIAYIVLCFSIYGLMKGELTQGRACSKLLEKGKEAGIADVATVALAEAEVLQVGSPSD